MFFHRNQVKTKKRKKVFTAIWDYIRPEFVGFIRASWLLIVSSSSAQISMGGRLNLDGGTLNLDGGTLTLDGGTRPPYNLSSAYSSVRNVLQYFVFFESDGLLFGINFND